MDLVDGIVKDVSGVVAPFFCVDAGVRDPSDHSWGKEVRVLEESVDVSVDAEGNGVNGGGVPGASFSSVAMVQADGNTESWDLGVSLHIDREETDIASSILFWLSIS